MLILPVILGTLCLGCWIAGSVCYVRCMLSHDVMGASFSFSGAWVFGSILGSAALGLSCSIRQLPAIGICLGFVAVGSVAIGALETALNVSDPEVASRVKEILAGINSDLARVQRERMQTALLNAKGVRVRFEAEWGSADGHPKAKRELSGSWIIGQGGKASGFLRIKSPFYDSSQNSIVFLSDGSHWIGGTRTDASRVTPTHFRDLLITGLLDVGPAFASILICKQIDLGGLFDPFGGLESRVDYRLVELKADQTKELVYTLKEPEEPPYVQTRLTYSAKTSTPIRRELTIFDRKTSSACGFIKETYEQFTVDDEPSDEEFKLPGNGK